MPSIYVKEPIESQVKIRQKRIITLARKMKQVKIVKEKPSENQAKKGPPWLESLWDLVPCVNETKEVKKEMRITLARKTKQVKIR